MGHAKLNAALPMITFQKKIGQTTDFINALRKLTWVIDRVGTEARLNSTVLNQSSHNEEKIQSLPISSTARARLLKHDCIIGLAKSA